MRVSIEQTIKIEDMKKIIAALLLAAFCQGIHAQEPVLTFDGELYFIPGSMTKEGEAYMVAVNTSDYSSLTIYDGDFNVVRELAPTAGVHYQQRRVTLTRVVDPGTSSDPRTRAATDDWTVESDQTFDYTTNPIISSFEMYSDDNNYHSRNIFVTQTLFDDDEEFEYVRTKQTIVPISMKYDDYVKEHSTGNEPIYTPINISYGDATLDSIMKANGAYSYQYFRDSESGKQMLRLYKYESYGGLYGEGLEIVTLDGTVKAFLPGITYL